MAVRTVNSSMMMCMPVMRLTIRRIMRCRV